MIELWEILQKFHNWFYAFEITFSLGLWLISVLGILSLHSFDHHLGIEGPGEAVSLDVHPDISVDMADTSALVPDASALGHPDISFWDGLAGFLYLGKVPFSIIMTVWMFTQGILGIWLNESLAQYFFSGKDLPFWVGALGFVGTFGLSLITTAGIVRPISPLFKDYGLATKAEALVGKTAQINTSKITADFGQAIYKLENGETIDITVRPLHPELDFKYGEKVLIVDYNPDKNIYLVDKAP
jgi:hypothetical protein